MMGRNILPRLGRIEPNLGPCTFLASPLVGLALLLLTSCAPEPKPSRLAGATMGTRYHIRFASLQSDAALAELQAAVDTILDTIDRQMSTYRQDSEIARFNRFGSTNWFPVSPALAGVVDAAREVSFRTEGAFDITVGPLAQLWGFGPDDRPQRVPSESEIEDARRRVGYRKLESRLNPPCLRKLAPDLEIDVSALAKGHAVDVLAEEFRRRSIGSFLIEIGGEIRTRGSSGNGKPWRLGIESPGSAHSTRATGRHILAVVEAADLALATSGDYRNYFEAEGRRYTHVFDPRTGRPVAHDLDSVTVAAALCREADALATALLVMGPVQGVAYGRSNNLAAMFLTRNGTNQVATVTGNLACQRVLSLP